MRRTPGLALEQLDRDHQELFRQLSELRSALRAGIRSRVETTLAFVRTYVDMHFDAEEREMLATGYPHFHVHRLAHGRLAREIGVLHEEWTKHGVTPALAEGVLEALGDWFELHVLELDAQLVRHLKAAAGETPRLGAPSRTAQLPS